MGITLRLAGHDFCLSARYAQQHVGRSELGSAGAGRGDCAGLEIDSALSRRIIELVLFSSIKLNSMEFLT